MRVAERCGWVHGRTKGSHQQLTKPGQRTLTVPVALTSGTALNIIKILERSSR
ncbi:MAG: type II toxin-antitoxin system HicA family toxin [Chloroflexota bacterium]|nr:type II toxin-antitoxin system HicA family toxin [Chloroflexota bacterium]